MGMWEFFGRLFGGGRKDGLESRNFGKDAGNGNGAGTKLKCVECKSVFLFETGEQQFFKQRGLTPPKRCPTCRSKKRRHRRR